MTKGRPKSSQPTATENISLRVTPDQKALLLKAVKEFNVKNGTDLSVSAYMQKLWSNEKVKEVPDTLVSRTYVNNPLWSVVSKIAEKAISGKTFLHTIRCAGKSDQIKYNMEVGRVSIFHSEVMSTQEAIAQGGTISIIKQVMIENGCQNLSEKVGQAVYTGENGFSGVCDWIPVSDPGVLHNVDRSVNPTHLGGTRIDGRQSSIMDGIIDGNSKVASFGGKTDYIFMSFTKYANLLRQNDAKVFTKVEIDGTTYEGLQVFLPTGYATVLPDRFCPPDQVFGLNMKTWKYVHIGDPVQIFNYDGNKYIRTTDQDSFELRVFTLGNLVCDSPKDNFVIQVNP